ncbi:hypothetical protein AXG93_1064s1000 [Marchantia polymorpha subsp. ruderalis]|uniref:Secreted protein n=1 Tax=Marchantia polymorpha subsp. ruderalis TaxID=1480154 RepID=A0A176VN08_MARPO|nr:hypothetical protein AXG93_1064s1000 [Marchantia polymorpha subsp. ruderalis]
MSTGSTGGSVMITLWIWFFPIKNMSSDAEESPGCAPPMLFLTVEGWRRVAELGGSGRCDEGTVSECFATGNYQRCVPEMGSRQLVFHQVHDPSA